MRFDRNRQGRSRGGRDERRGSPRVYRDRPSMPIIEPGTVRVFTGIPLSQDLLRKIEKTVHRLDPFGKSMRWVNFRSVHLTLHFFASLKEEKLPLLKDITENIVISVKPFDLKFAKAGFFPDERMPRVFWWGLEPSQALRDLYQRLTARYREENIPLEKRSFKAHITLGRFRDPVTLNRDMVIQLEKVWDLKGSVFRADHLRLFKSPAGPDGYETIQAFPFKG
jgi:2'-5' RNA ligase